jgi:hypothetical protein
MIVLAGREGRWKYEVGADEEDEMPRREFGGAVVRGLDAKDLLECCCKTESAGGAVKSGPPGCRHVWMAFGVFETRTSLKAALDMTSMAQLIH